MKYKKIQLKDVADIVMGQSPKSVFYNTNGNGTPFLQGVRTFGENYPQIDTWTTSYNRKAKSGEILFSVRAPVGRVNWANQDLAVGRQLDSLATGTVFTSINKKELEAIELKIPVNLSDQEKIADYLQKIDQEIELNNQINDNLDALLTNIFKKYMINDGFEKSNLTQIANYKNGLAMQKYRPNSNEESLPVLKIKELNQGNTDDSSDRCSANLDNSVIVNTGDIIFSWSGTLLVKNWTGDKAGLNQHLFKVTSNKYPAWFIYEWTKYHLLRFQAIAAGKATTMGHIKRSDLKSSLVYIPSQLFLAKMDSQLAPIYSQRLNLIKENQQLSKLKQTLLKKYF